MRCPECKKKLKLVADEVLEIINTYHISGFMDNDIAKPIWSSGPIETKTNHIHTTAFKCKNCNIPISRNYLKAQLEAQKG